MKLFRQLLDFNRSIYWRIATSYFGLLALSITASATIYWFIWQRGIQSESQLIYWHSAEALADELEPLTAKQLDYEAVLRVFRSYLHLNPASDPYLLDSDGTILVAPFGKTSEQVDLVPLRRFLGHSSPSAEPIYIENPLNKMMPKTTFSAAPITISGKQGYVFIVLTGFRKTGIYQRIGDITLIAGSILNIVVFVLVSGIFGVFLFRRITKRFKTLNTVMSEFEAGSLGSRASVYSEDELGLHAKAFNQMADAIEAAIEALNKADKNRRALVANVSQELYSPVKQMRIRLKNIEENSDTLDQDEVRALLAEAVGACKALNRLLSELFELAKLNTQGYRPQTDLIDAADIISDLSQSYRQQANDCDIAFETELPSNPLYTQADSRLFNKAVSSLFDNAVRFTPAGGRVSIELRASNGMFSLRVTDNGPGIAEKDLPNIFNRLMQDEAGKQPGGEHHGFSLAIVKRMAEVHGGSLSVETELGKGTTFVLEFPIAEI